MSCPQIWNIEKEKDIENKEGGDRIEKLNKKKSNRESYSERKKTKATNFIGRTMWKFCSGSEKIRNASGQQGENEQQWKKSEQEYKQQILGGEHTTFSS